MLAGKLLWDMVLTPWCLRRQPYGKALMLSCAILLLSSHVLNERAHKGPQGP